MELAETRQSHDAAARARLQADAGPARGLSSACTAGGCNLESEWQQGQLPLIHALGGGRADRAVEVCLHTELGCTA